MTHPELLAFIAARKARAFDHALHAAELDPKILGARTFGEASVNALRAAKREIEAAIQKFERENPR